MSELQVTVIIGPTDGTGQSVVSTRVAQVGSRDADRAGLLSYYAHEVTRAAVAKAVELEGWE